MAVMDRHYGYVGDRATYLKAVFNEETGQVSENEDVQAAAVRLAGILDVDDQRARRKWSRK